MDEPPCAFVCMRPPEPGQHRTGGCNNSRRCSAACSCAPAFCCRAHKWRCSPSPRRTLRAGQVYNVCLSLTNLEDASAKDPRAKVCACILACVCVCLSRVCVCLSCVSACLVCVCLSCVPACPVCVSACLVCLPVLSVCLLVTLVCTCCLRCAYVHAASGVRVSCVPCPGVCGMPREVRCFGSLAYAYSWVYEEAGQARPDRRLRSPCSGPRVFCTSEASALVYA